MIKRVSTSSPSAVMMHCWSREKQQQSSLVVLSRVNGCCYASSLRHLSTQQQQHEGPSTPSSSSSTPHQSTEEQSHDSSSASASSSSSASSTSTSSALSWKDRFAHLPIFKKHKMNRNGTDFDALPEPRVLPKFTFHGRMWYSQPFRSQKLDNYLKIENGQLLSMATTYQHTLHKDITVTLVPLSHTAHPQFYYQVDLLLCQHDSVLMEGRVPFKQAPFSTLVPPRPLPNQIRPADISETTVSWEPTDMSAFWQPFSWGVRDSPNYTVIHAADCYDYEKLPVLASLRWNMPLLGSFKREVHCLSMIPFLVDNGYKKFAVPWGASHMPIMHEMLLANGFAVTSVSALPVFDECDGEISKGFVRQNAHVLTRKESREDAWLAILLMCVTFTYFYYNARVIVDGEDVLRNGQQRQAEMEEEVGDAFIRKAKSSTVANFKTQGVDGLTAQLNSGGFMGR